MDQVQCISLAKPMQLESSEALIEAMKQDKQPASLLRHLAFRDLGWVF